MFSGACSGFFKHHDYHDNFLVYHASIVYSIFSSTQWILTIEKRTSMIHNSFLNTLGKALRFYTGFALTILLLQLVGLLMYFLNVWPEVQNTLSTGATLLVGLAVILVLIRSCIWMWIYWSGAGAITILRQSAGSTSQINRLPPILMTLTRLLVISSIMDLFFAAPLFLSETLLLSMSGWWLGIVYFTILLFPQAFGVAALILAFLMHQYGLLLKDRSQMKEEIELTI